MMIQCFPLYISLLGLLPSPTETYYWGGANWEGDQPWQEQLPVCSMESYPCDMAVKLYASTTRLSAEIYSTEKPMCRCPNDNTCPTGWNTDGPQSIARDFISRGKRTGIALHYCQPLGQERTCIDDEVALVMEGSSIPEGIKEVNCKCPGSEPLKIRRSYYKGWKLIQELVCSIPQCSTNVSRRQACQRITHVKDPHTWMWTFRITNLCECPSGYSCEKEMSTSRDERYGYCESVMG